jgi:uncharacterized phiE125 gp8 family phage protein
VSKEPQWKRVEAPSEPLLSVEDARAHLRVEHDDEDELIAQYCAAAEQWVEEFTSRAFVTQTWELQLPRWPSAREIRLPRPPLQAVTWVKWTDDEGVERTMSPDYYEVDTISEPGLIELVPGARWPDANMAIRSVNVRFVAGYGAASDVPPAVLQAARFLVGHFHENRESVVVGSYNPSHVPDTVRALLWPWRVW